MEYIGKGLYGILIAPLGADVQSENININETANIHKISNFHSSFMFM
jgi:hypothetical protein